MRLRSEIISIAIIVCGALASGCTTTPEATVEQKPEVKQELGGKSEVKLNTPCGIETKSTFTNGRFSTVQTNSCTGERRDSEEEYDQVLGGPSKEAVNIEYQNFIKSNKCEKVHWSRYDAAKEIQNVAVSGKLTAYDLIFGDEYTRRNVSALSALAANLSASKYVVEMPEPISKKFDQDFPTELERAKNKRTVFNLSIKRDYECYKKLK